MIPRSLLAGAAAGLFALFLVALASLAHPAVVLAYAAAVLLAVAALAAKPLDPS